MAALTAGRLDPLRWMGAPMAACMALTLLFAAPVSLFGLQLPEPVFAMVPAFAWAVLRPSLVGPLFLFVLGLFDDLVWGGRLGLWALGLLVAYGFVIVTRSLMTGRSPLMNWIWYVAAWSAGMGAAYVAAWLDVHNQPNLWAVVGQWLPTALLYPVANHLIGRFEDADPRFR
jgi:rod shape-determining protein MreD